MELTSLIAKTKTIKVPFPDMQGFVVEINYIGKEEIRKITEKCKTVGFDKKTRQPTESIDDELFAKNYVNKSLVGWSGLKYDFLKELILVEEGAGWDGEALVDYTETNAYTLVTNSSTFDTWLSSVMSDISLFNKGS